MRGGVVSGRYVGPHGRPHPVGVSANELLDILLAGDFDPILRAELPAAVRAAAGGDNAPLARLLVHAVSGEGEEGEGIDTPLYYTTTCEEEDFPWSRSAGPGERLAQARTQIGALPTSAFAPFTATNVLDFDELRGCAYWPFATPAPPAVTEAMPDVPTLILSGADDLRTPTANARAVAAQIPDAHLLVVPNTGHAVLEDEPTSCARKALQAMFTGGLGVQVGGAPIKPCSAGPPASPLLMPTPLCAGATRRCGPVARLPRPGRADTAGGGADDRRLRPSAHDPAACREQRSQPHLAEQRRPALRLGTALQERNELPRLLLRARREHLRHGKAEKVALRVGGAAAARGTLHLGSHKALVAELGGQRVSTATSPTATAAAVGSDARTGSLFALRGAAVRAAAHRLAGLLGELPWD